MAGLFASGFVLVASLSAPIAYADPCAATDSSAQVANTHQMKLFLASVIGKPKSERKSRASTILDAVEKKLETCPDDASLHLLKVASLGTLARATNFQDSVTQRFGSKTKEALKALEEVAPDHPWTLTLEGVWHFEVKRRGGSMGAGMLGASVKQGKEKLDKAVQLAGRRDPGIPYAYAIALLSTNAKKNADISRSLLQTAHSIAVTLPDDPSASVIIQPIDDLLELLAEKEYEDASDLASELL